MSSPGGGCTIKKESFYKQIPLICVEIVILYLLISRFSWSLVVMFSTFLLLLFLFAFYEYWKTRCAFKSLLHPNDSLGVKLEPDMNSIKKVNPDIIKDMKNKQNNTDSNSKIKKNKKQDKFIIKMYKINKQSQSWFNEPYVRLGKDSFATLYDLKIPKKYKEISMEEFEKLYQKYYIIPYCIASHSLNIILIQVNKQSFLEYMIFFLFF